MATKFYFLSGKAKWVKNRNPDEKYQNWTINLYLDTASKEVFSDSGLQLKSRTDDGGEFVTFRRPMSKVIKNELVKFGPPPTTKDGAAYEGIVGNGSEVTIKVAVYDTVKGPGHRWEALRVDNLVEYTPPPQGAAAPATTGAAKPAPKSALPF